MLIEIFSQTPALLTAVFIVLAIFFGVKASKKNKSNQM
tara:strand:+ start:173 stop:286 length:114 start_codon:yes stop_codon:yes gene_type:complete